MLLGSKQRAEGIPLPRHPTMTLHGWACGRTCCRNGLKDAPTWDRSRLDPSRLGFAERIIAKRLPEGDWRDWPAIEAWAVGIAQKLRAPQPATR
jgi:hypothetical protein